MNLHLGYGWIAFIAIIYLAAVSFGFQIYRKRGGQIPAKWERLSLICVAFGAGMTTSVFWMIH